MNKTVEQFDTFLFCAVALQKLLFPLFPGGFSGISQFPQFTGFDTEAFHADAGHVLGVGKSAGHGYIGNAHGHVVHEAQTVFKTYIVEVLLKTHAEVFGEEMGKMGGRDAFGLGHFGQTDGILVVGVYVGYQAAHALGYLTAGDIVVFADDGAGDSDQQMFQQAADIGNAAQFVAILGGDVVSGRADDAPPQFSVRILFRTGADEILLEHGVVQLREIILHEVAGDLDDNGRNAAFDPFDAVGLVGVEQHNRAGTYCYVVAGAVYRTFAFNYREDLDLVVEMDAAAGYIGDENIDMLEFAMGYYLVFYLAVIVHLLSRPQPPQRADVNQQIYYTIIVYTNAKRYATTILHYDIIP